MMKLGYYNSVIESTVGLTLVSIYIAVYPFHTWEERISVEKIVLFN